MTALALRDPKREISLLRLDPNPGRNGELAAVDYCRKVVDRFEARQPCGDDTASKIGELMTAAYPTMRAHSPKQYAAMVSATIAKYPEAVALEALERMTERLRFLPTRADVYAALEEVVEEQRKLYRAAKTHLAEHARRREERDREARAEEDREALKALLGDAWDDWWAIPPLVRFRGGMPAQFAAGWKAAADKAEFCAAWGAEEARTA